MSPYDRPRFPAEIIGHSVWLYFRFALSFRDIEQSRQEDKSFLVVAQRQVFWSAAVLLPPPSDAAFQNLWRNPVGTTPVARDYVLFALYIYSLPEN